jgi:hypothetical protein
MSRILPLFVTAALTVIIASFPTGSKAYQTPTTPKANFTAEAGDSPRVRCTWDDVAKKSYFVRRIDTSNTSIIMDIPALPGSLSVEDTSPSRKKTYKYELHFGNHPRDNQGILEDKTVTTTDNSFPAERNKDICDDMGPLVDMKWLQLGGIWFRDQSKGIVQQDDGPSAQLKKKIIRTNPPIDLSKLAKSAPENSYKMQVRASVVLEGWNKLVAAAGALKTPPTYAVGVGFAYPPPNWDSGYFLVFHGDGQNQNVVIEDGKGVPCVGQLNVAFPKWSDAKKFWMQLRIEKDQNGMAVLQGKIWDDTQPESAAVTVALTSPQAWPVPDPSKVGTLQPALYGGIQGDSGRLKVSFPDLCLETFPTTAPTIAANLNIPPLPPESPRRLVEPALDECVRIPNVAITRAWTSQWGTLLGRVEPEPPIRLEACPPLDCRWTVPTASKSVCCSYAGALARESAIWPARVDGTIVHDDPAPVLAPYEGVEEGGVVIDPPTTPFPGLQPLIPTEPLHGRNRPRLHHRIQKTSGTPRRDTKFRRISLTSDDDVRRDIGEPDLAAPGVTPPSSPMPPMTEPDTPRVSPGPATPATRAGAQSGRQPLIRPLDTRPTTRQGLRDFGAIATLPDKVKDVQNAYDQADKACAEQIVRILVLRAVEDIMKEENRDKTQDSKTRVELRKATDIKDLQKLLKSAKVDLLRVEQNVRSHIQSDLPAEFHASLQKWIDATLASLGLVQTLEKFRRETPSFPSKEYLSRSGHRDEDLREPFEMLPCAVVVPICPPGASERYRTSSRFGASQIAGPPKPLFQATDPQVWTYHFDHPARFPMTRFGAPCCGFEGEGAVIHEGMRLLAHQDGRYEVRFNITAPSTPIVLRLQLILFQENKKLPEPRSHDDPKGAPVPRTITLAPILIRPDTSDSKSFPNDPEGGTYPTSYFVSAQGYSQVIKETQGSDTGPDHFLLVKRIGTARLGAGVLFQAR